MPNAHYNKSTGKDPIFMIAMLLSFTWLLTNCKEKPDDPVDKPYVLTPYTIKLPAGFPPIFRRDDNPLSEEGIELGKMLYYDKALHPLGDKACATCHVQATAFSKATNEGILTHQNLAWKNFFLWNGKVEGSLEDIMLFEVEKFFQTDLSAIKEKPEYRTKFKQVFGTEEITTQRAAYAMAQFLTSLISADSKFDKVNARKDAFTFAEQRGFDLFFSEKGDCFHCHAPPMFTDYAFHNTGLDSVFIGRNAGRFEVTGKDYDLGKMFTPTLRNIGITAPYMHDGRFATLEEAIEHYNSGVIKTPSLDPLMTKNDSTAKKKLTAGDIADLKAFLLTLTDTSFLNNPKHASPF